MAEMLISKESNTIVSRRSLVSEIAVLLLFLCVYALPLAFQHPFLSLYNLYGWSLYTLNITPWTGQIVLWSIALSTGLVCFPSRKRAAWGAGLLCLLLAAVAARSAEHTWSCWRKTGTAPIQWNYAIECGILALLPLQYVLWRIGAPVIAWAFLSAGCAAFLQAFACVSQFLAVYSFGFRSAVASYFLNDPNLMAVRDSGRLHLGTYRFTGLLYNPNVCAMIIVTGWPAILAAALRRHRRPVPFALLMAASLVCLMGILLTYSRAAYLALCVQGCLLLIIYRKTIGKWASAIFAQRVNRARRSAWLLLLAAAVFCLFALPSVSSRVRGIVDFNDRSYINRAHVFTEGISLIIERPLAGWGPGVFNTLYNRFYKLPDERYSYFDVHSTILNTFLEIGTAGVLIWMFFFLDLVRIRQCLTIPLGATLGLAGV
jgi:hypothetical protein